MKTSFLKIKTCPSAVLLLLAALIGMSACADTASGGEQTQSADAGTGDAVFAETEAVGDRAMHALDTDALDFGGEELNMAAFDWQGYSYYFFADAENGDNMNDALYHRKRAVEEALNITMVSTMYGSSCSDYAAALKPLILAGDDVYDLMFNHCIEGIAAYASEGYLYNLDLLPHVDMDAAWWNKTQMDILRLGDNTYYAVNDMMIPCPYVIFFNKELVSNYDMESPYDLVYSGTWTLDQFEEMARTATIDVNGDSKMDKNDSYGMIANEGSKYISFMTGAGQYLTKRDTDGRVVLDANTEKMQALVTRFAALAKDDVCYLPKSDKFTDLITIDSGRMMFQLQDISYAEQMRGFTVDFGLVPYPKYDEKQEDYISLDWGGLLSVPCTITNPEMVGAAMELLAWESGNEVIPTYYNTVLTGKLARDSDAVKMLDIIFDTITYEVGGNYFGFTGGISDLFYAIPRLAIEDASADFASFYEKNEKSAVKNLESFYETLYQNEESQS